ncbi:MAG TPA: hypothetical protein DDY13_09430 [Cytophagales bacterium]|nr:hypothetical protein [Cytophagales bacterium]
MWYGMFPDFHFFDWLRINFKYSTFLAFYIIWGEKLLQIFTPEYLNSPLYSLLYPIYMSPDPFNCLRTLHPFNLISNKNQA